MTQHAKERSRTIHENSFYASILPFSAVSRTEVQPYTDTSVFFSRPHIIGQKNHFGETTRLIYNFSSVQAYKKNEHCARKYDTGVQEKRTNTVQEKGTCCKPVVIYVPDCV
jgi:hypothetical protein